MQAGIVSDDFTGGNDIAGRFGGAGFRAYSCLGMDAPASVFSQAGVLVLNARSRFLKEREAFRASRAAWQRMPRHGGIQWLYQKIDSTLRGHPAAEIEGLVAESGAAWVAVVPAYPLFGRQTRQGAHYVHGRRLDHTEYARDPLTPARGFRVDRLFKGSWSAHVGLAQVGRGPVFLAAALKKTRRERPGARFVSFDATESRHLETIARACLKAGCRAFAGASGLAGALAEMEGAPRRGIRVSSQAPPGARARRVLVLAGTLSQTTLDQLAQAEKKWPGAWVSLTGDDYLSRVPGPSASLARKCRQAWKPGKTLWLSTVRGRQEAWEARRRAGRLGLGREELAQRAIQTLARLGSRLWNPGTAVILTGGHTAEAFFEVQGLQGAWILGELAPGVPLGFSEKGGAKVWIASKPGGFGEPVTLVRAAERLLSM